MATWSSRRKFLYGGTLLVVVIAIVGGIFFSLFYKAPTCYDRIMNGDEKGVDCGGSCIKLCQSTFLPAKIAWGGGKFEKVADGLYNVAAYIVNPNTNAAAVKVPYKFSIYDGKGLIVTTREGVIDIPAHRNTLAFEPAVLVSKRIPAKVTFEFLAPPLWFKSHDTLEGITIIDKKYSEDSKNSSLEVTLENESLLPYKNITVSAVLSDKDGNTIGFSRTLIDSISPKSAGQPHREIAPFTWPKSRNGEVVSIEALPVAVPVRD